jgi:hypothetical protein
MRVVVRLLLGAIQLAAGLTVLPNLFGRAQAAGRQRALLEHQSVPLPDVQRRSAGSASDMPRDDRDSQCSSTAYR